MELDHRSLSPAPFKTGRGSTASSVRRDSAIVSDAPITPPMSPTHSENGDDDDIMIDAQPRYSGPIRAPYGDYPSMDVDETPEIVKKPQRILEDERVHLYQDGMRLTDFEVRGTLGKPVVFL
jgi:hypothetical protein